MKKVLVALMVMTMIPLTAKGANVSGTIELNSSSELSFGGQVSFDTTVDEHVKIPRVEVLCYQDGELVYGEAGSNEDSFLLGGGGSEWIDRGGGPASCVANLFFFDKIKGRQTYSLLDSVEFSAGP
jgi:hypothetical protein